MTKEKFNLNEKDLEDEHYGPFIGEYVEVRNPYGATVMIGKLIGIRDGIGYFSPHTKIDYTKENPKRYLDREIATQELRSTGTIIPQTRKNIEAFFEILDREDLEKKESQRLSKD